MIQTIVTHTCPKCGSENLVKNGHDYKGAQKYYCKACDSYGTLCPHRGYAAQMRAQVKRAVLERVSLRGIERLLGVSRRTVAEAGSLGRDAAAAGNDAGRGTVG